MSDAKTFTAETYIDAYYPDQNDEMYTREQVKRMLIGFAKLKCKEQREICFGETTPLMNNNGVGIDIFEQTQISIKNAEEPVI